MGLTSSLYIGRSGLQASQTALQVTGNNIANVGTKGFHRQRVTLEPVAPGDRLSQLFIGRGVSIADVRRAVEPALQARMRNSASEREEAGISRSMLSQIETLMSELGENDLSSQLSTFFNAFSELANNPSALSNRAVVVEQGQSLASFIQSLQGDLARLKRQIDDQLRTNVQRADALLTELAEVNRAIAGAELGAGEDGNLRDQRDLLIDELSMLVDVNVIERDSGMVDILIGSQPILSGTRSRGLEIEFLTVGSTVEARLRTKTDAEVLKVQSGAIGGLLAERGGSVSQTMTDLGEVASALIFEVNRLHTSGRPQSRLTDITGWLEVEPPDQALALNDPTNTSLSGLPFAPTTGSFDVVITDSSGAQSRTTIRIDLDGIDSTGAVGFADDTSLNDLVAQLDAISNLSAQITPGGQLRLVTDAGFDVSFADDTSGALATLGVATFFQGTDATDIAIATDLRNDPLRLSVGLSEGSNETALAITALREGAVDTLGGDSISARWQKTIERTAVQTASATTRATAASAVFDSLQAQNAAVSGVSLDDEAVNLITYQQQYTGAARFINVVNEMTDVLLSLV